jgi:hypothetical protein
MNLACGMAGNITAIAELEVVKNCMDGVTSLLPACCNSSVKSKFVITRNCNSDLIPDTPDFERSSGELRDGSRVIPSRLTFVVLAITSTKHESPLVALDRVREQIDRSREMATKWS